MAAGAKRRRKHPPGGLLIGLLILGLAAIGFYLFLFPRPEEEGPALVFVPGEADLPDVPWKVLSLSPDGDFLAIELAGQSLVTRRIGLLNLREKAFAGLVSGPTEGRHLGGQTSAPIGPRWLAEPGTTGWLVLEGCRPDESVTGLGTFEIGSVDPFPRSSAAGLWELSIGSGKAAQRLSLPGGIIWPVRVMGERVGFSLGIGESSYGLIEWSALGYQTVPGVPAESRLLGSTDLRGPSVDGVLLAFPDRLGLISSLNMKMRILGSLASLDGNPNRSVPHQRCLYAYEAQRVGFSGDRIVFPVTIQEGARGRILNEVWFLDFASKESGVLWQDTASSGFVSGAGMKIGFKRALGTTYSRFRIGSIGIVADDGPLQLLTGFPPQSVFAEFRHEDEIICVLEESREVWSVTTDGKHTARLYP